MKNSAKANTADNNSLVTIEFNGDNLLAHVDEHGEKLVAVRPICEGMGMAWNSQYTKLNNNPKFSCYDIITTASDGKKYKMKALPIKQVNTWLSEINVARCKEEVQSNVLKYQQECMKALNDYWTEGKAENPRMSEDEVKTEALPPNMIHSFDAMINNIVDVAMRTVKRELKDHIDKRDTIIAEHVSGLEKAHENLVEQIGSLGSQVKMIEYLTTAQVYRLIQYQHKHFYFS